MLSFVGHSADFILRSVDDSSFRWLFGILRASFSRQIGILSGVPDTILGLRPTKGRIVRFFVIFGVRSPDRCGNSRVYGVPSWAFARQCCHTSAIRLTSFFVQSTIPAFVGCSTFFPLCSASSLGFFNYFQSALPGLDICTFQTTVST